MRERKALEERGAANEVRECQGNIAAFFDLDGTLMALPSLERRFFRTLRYQRAIRAKNYFSWLKQALRLLPRGISTILQANKMYLRGVQILDERGEGDRSVYSRPQDGHQAQGQASAHPRRIPRLPVPAFFTQAIEKVAWRALAKASSVTFAACVFTDCSFVLTVFSASAALCTNTGIVTSTFC